MDFIKRKGKRRRFWMDINEDAKGYGLGDNRINPAEDRREVVRRTWNI
jgi:hypothetical protein